MIKRIIILSLILLVSVIVIILSKTPADIIRTYINIDNDSDNEEFIISSGQLQIKDNDTTIYRSDPSWTVTLYDHADCNNDGINELLVGFWRIGDYGVDNRFSRTRRDPLPSYHLYLYQYMEEAQNFRLIWGSSTLNDPIYSLSVEEINTDNNILKVINGSYKDYDDEGIIEPLDTSYWIWEDWYFKQL